VTDVVSLPRSIDNCCDGAPRGSWWASENIILSVKCALCGRCATLKQPSGGHDIAADGTVTPSIVCPYAPCSWHVWAKLLDWKPR
jgi:hypothetical protein